MFHVPADRPHLAHWPRRLPRELVLPETSLWFNLEVSATRYPDKPLYLFFGRRHRYAQVRAQAEALAGWLQSVAGVRRGDRVVLFMQNCPQYAVAYYAVLRADAVVVPVNPMNRADEFGHAVSDPEARVIICSADLAGVVEAAQAELPAARRAARVLVTRYADAMDAPEATDPEDAPSAAMDAWLRADPALPVDADGVSPSGARWTRWTQALDAGLVPEPHRSGPDDLAILPYTSGTTGLPKGCMHTHRTLMANVVGAGTWAPSGAESVSLGVVPMFHITGMMYGLHAPIMGGATVVVMPRWDRELAGRLISRHRVSHWVCIPTMIIDLFGSPNYARFDLSSLRYLSGGGAAMPQAVAQRLLDEFGITFAEGYGLTETAAPTHANPPERAKLQCLGIPIFGVDARVVDPVGLQELPPGEIGEIIVRGPMVFQGYWRHEEATAAAFCEFDGRRFFRTGDLGRMDEEGYFFITDRLKRMINASGFKVWPAEVELLLYKHPAVQEACIISTQDAYRGESVKAVIVPRSEARGRVTAQEIIDWAREHMAAYKVPRVVEFVEALPKSGSGKVMWRLLQDREHGRQPPG
ncbi:long-chain fatty acid--CoA ligase [Piscinibacter sakaiensis]|uniref:Long-chain-fatty-acid--CoA ligase n=1 Tax=Piscinibacter sakaiensis TaxID=1547922 RepID=A0A0K8NZG0_PISS1|nr:long-chain fatty acid--CoA ligase [Piscinibacter sakaiensis]GAP35771.1 long-chain-fatty-acid--CoA ligase [Piscinibacter sakaiensis]